MRLHKRGSESATNALCPSEEQVDGNLVHDSTPSSCGAHFTSFRRDSESRFSSFMVEAKLTIS